MTADLRNILGEIGDEVRRAEIKHAPMNSVHEGYAVLLEEVDELWYEVKKKTASRDMAVVREECIQIAAMAVRLIRDLVDRAR